MMKMSRQPFLLLFWCLGALEACKPTPTPPIKSLAGRYQVLTLTEKPYTDNSVNDLILFDNSPPGCTAQAVTLSFSKNGLLTTSILPPCRSHTGWLAQSGLVNASRWVLTGTTLVITPTRGQPSSFGVELIDQQLALSWLGADSSFVGLDGQLVTYSLALKRL